MLRAEVEITLDGTTVTALLAPKGKTAPRPVERIEILGTPQRGPDVNVVLSSKSKRRRDEGSDGQRDGTRRPRPGGAERGERGSDGDKRGARRARADGSAANPVPPVPTQVPVDGPARPGPAAGTPAPGRTPAS